MSEELDVRVKRVTVEAEETSVGLGKGIDLGPDLDAFGPIEESVPVPRASESDPGPPTEESLSFEPSPPPEPPKKGKRRKSNQIELEEPAPRPVRAEPAAKAETTRAGSFEIPTPAGHPATILIDEFGRVAGGFYGPGDVGSWDELTAALG